MVLISTESWGSGLNPVPPKVKVVLTLPQQQWLFPCALERHDFLFFSQWLRSSYSL